LTDFRDHAGIATQLQVENALRSQGTSRQELGREKFLEKVFEWKDAKGSYIVEQMKRLGVSADWSKEQFTLSQPLSEAVTDAFVQLHNRGLIYKGKYMVNWCPKLQTAVSDLEVDYSEEVGLLYFINYPLSDGTGHLTVATTRPETMLGDTAVCVHPDDERYKHFIGKTVVIPVVGRKVPGD
jgi:valyl-tRNA synthetase